MEIRRAQSTDQWFLVEMARLACVLEGRHPLPAADATEVLDILPGAHDPALVATHERGHSLGAIWCHRHDPPLLHDQAGHVLPEMAMAVSPPARRHGVGTALIDGLTQLLRGQGTALALNVHLLNPAARLYVRTGFRVAGPGRGWYGVAMTRPLSKD